MPDPTATDLLSGAETEEATEEVTEEAVEEEGEEEATDEEGPSPDHPRFKQVYGKLKQRERELDTLKSDVELMKQHNSQLSEQMRSQEAAIQAAQQPDEPDIETDPQEWRTWKMNADQQRMDELKGDMNRQQLAWQVDIMRSTHEDYDEKVKTIASKLDTDESLRQEVWNATNPPLAAYKMATKDEAKDLADEENADQMAMTEGGRAKTPKAKGKISDDERRMMRVFNMDEDEWREQRSILNEQRG